MAKNFEIQLKFTTGKTAQKLIKHLNNLAKAQDKVAKTQKKFNNDAAKAAKHVQILTQREQKHVVVMKKQQKQMQILNNRIKQQNVRLATLQGKLKLATIAQNRMRISTAGLQRNLGVIRNKLLLVTFAFGGVVTAIKKAIDTSAEFEAVKVRLNAMFGSVEKGTKAFEKFNDIAATTPFTLQDVVEGGAALKAFGADAEALIKPTADLAAFMGTTAAEAASALGRAFAGGAGAADILRERGILQLIRDFKGIDDLTKLTLPEFRKAIEETLLDPASGIAGATDKLAKTTVGMMSNLSDSFTRMSAAFGDLINIKGQMTFLTKTFTALKDFFVELNKTDFDKIKELNESLEIKDVGSIDEISNSLLKYKLLEKEIGDDKTLVGSREKLKNTEKSLLDVLNRRALIESNNALTYNKQSLEKENKEERFFSRSRKRLFEEIALFGKLEEARNEVVQEVLNVPGAAFAGGIGAEVFALPKLEVRGLLPSFDEMGEPFKVFGKNLEDKLKQTIMNIDNQAAIDELQRILNLEQEFEKLVNDAQSMNLAFREQMFSEHFDKILDMSTKNLEARKNAELQTLRDTDAFRNASSEERESMEKDALKQFQSRQKMLFRLNQLNEIAKVVMSTQAAIADAALMISRLEIAAKFYKGTGNFAMEALAKSQIPGMVKQIGFSKASAAAQIGIIAGQQAPAFARGGSFTTQGEQFIKVGDNSGGRERVDITPLSSPDFGDAGGGSSINVNIMGNVIGTQEFVRDNLLPEIENTIRRNLA